MGLEPLRGREVHLLGVVGRGQAPVAIAARHLGARVTGCDRAPDPGRLEQLRSAGIEVIDGNDPTHVRPGVALVATSAATESDEARRAHELGQCYHRTDLLGAIIRTNPGLGITGSHGKGTVAALATAALARAGLDPLGVIGASVPALGGVVRRGSGPVVAEVDDSDLTLARLSTRVAVVTNLDEDHLYLGHPLSRVVQAVGEFVAQASDLVLLGPSPRREALASYARTRVWRYGREVRARTLALGEGWTDVSLSGPDGERARARVRLLGPRTHVNAALAFGSALALGADPEAAAAGLGDVDRILRRLEPVGERAGVRVFDDYGGKHPLNVRLGLQALRRHYPGAHITAAFEPHISALAPWGHRYARALSEADRVVVAPAVQFADFANRDVDARAWWRACTAPVDVASSAAELAPLAMAGRRAGDLVVFFAQRHLGYRFAEEALA